MRVFRIASRLEGIAGRLEAVCLGLECCARVSDGVAFASYNTAQVVQGRTFKTYGDLGLLEGTPCHSMMLCNGISLQGLDALCGANLTEIIAVNIAWLTLMVTPCPGASSLCTYLSCFDLTRALVCLTLLATEGEDYT